MARSTGGVRISCTVEAAAQSSTSDDRCGPGRRPDHDCLLPGTNQRVIPAFSKAAITKGYNVQQVVEVWLQAGHHLHTHLVGRLLGQGDGEHSAQLACRKAGNIKSSLPLHIACMPPQASGIACTAAQRCSALFPLPLPPLCRPAAPASPPTLGALVSGGIGDLEGAPRLVDLCLAIALELEAIHLRACTGWRAQGC